MEKMFPIFIRGYRLAQNAGLHTGAGTSTKAAQLEQLYPQIEIIDAGILGLPVSDHLPANLAIAGAKEQPDLSF